MYVYSIWNKTKKFRLCCYLYGKRRVHFEMAKTVGRNLFLSQIYLKATFNT